MISLKDKVALVTGASSGIGLAIARALVAEGSRVALFARRADLLKKIADDFGGNSMALPLPGDVRSPEDVERAVQSVLAKWGHVDVLVNNAGIYKTRDLSNTTLSDWKDLIDTNLTGPYLFCRAVEPVMARQNCGDIVNISSIAGLRAFSDCAAYCASKFGLVGFSKAIREELRHKGIRVILIHPGAVATDLWNVSGESDVDLSVMLKPEDVAEAVVQALSAERHNLQEDIVLTPIGGDV